MCWDLRVQKCQPRVGIKNNNKINDTPQLACRACVETCQTRVEPDTWPQRECPCFIAHMTPTWH